MGLHNIPTSVPQPQQDLPPLPQSPASPTRQPLLPKSTLLNANRQPQTPSERDLLRDIPYLLLGLPSTHFPLAPKSLTLPPTLPPPVVSLLYSLAEPGLLFRGLQDFIAAEEEGVEVGLVGQSLRGAIKVEIGGWMNLVAGVEAEIRRFLAVEGVVGVTLKRCAIWVREGTLGLRLMSVIIEETAGTPCFEDKTDV
jgi:gamma-tubulin complex component 3